ncbi:MAG: hypothetical protein CM15mP127_13680 [Gammaproteobacteria bacterium]|nr:MAG: hypothetical protein CM15mP127_13680 [Gammaproteobacteria bacterium]
MVENKTSSPVKRELLQGVLMLHPLEMVFGSIGVAIPLSKSYHWELLMVRQKVKLSSTNEYVVFSPGEYSTGSRWS